MSFKSLLNITCTIEVKSLTQDAAGQMTESWATAEANVKCRLDPIGGGLQTEPDTAYVAATHILFLLEPSITLTIVDHRIIISGTTYTILLVKNLYAQSDLDHLEVLLERV